MEMSLFENKDFMPGTNLKKGTDGHETTNNIYVNKEFQKYDSEIFSDFEEARIKGKEYAKKNKWKYYAIVSEIKQNRYYLKYNARKNNLCDIEKSLKQPKKCECNVYVFHNFTGELNW
jgi:hypothetical protein